MTPPHILPISNPIPTGNSLGCGFAPNPTCMESPGPRGPPHPLKWPPQILHFPHPESCISPIPTISCPATLAGDCENEVHGAFLKIFPSFLCREQRLWWSPSPSIPYRLLSTIPGWKNPLLSQMEHHQPVSASDAGVPPGRMGLGLQMDTGSPSPLPPTRCTSHVRRGAGGHHMSPSTAPSPIKKCPPMAASASFSFSLGSLL